jgi:arsenate reductase-like glutaredoxin family protein
MLKRVDIYSFTDDPGFEEIKRFLDNYDYDLRVRDLQVRPLNAYEISNIIRHFDSKHFISLASKAYKKFHLDKVTPSRKELIAMIAEDNELLRQPIIVAGRLMTVGCNRMKIMEMLQIKSNGSDPAENGRPENPPR